MDQNPKQLIVEKLKSASNVLVTVSTNPSVDQLATALGLTLMLNALGDHAITVFSGQIPNALEFLNPEKSFDNSVDSLRDFIISIDKEKADKLRYKVEDNVVRIFITPYKTTLSEADLSFSQGDYNVDVVVALGVNNKKDLDQAIATHGRILHDAAIVSITAGSDEEGDLGAINWHDSSASSLSEMLVSMSEALQSGILDKAMSSAFLTGIVSATDRFSNNKTSPKVMTMSAQLMAAGADQQLISKNLRMDRGRSKDLNTDRKLSELPEDESDSNTMKGEEAKDPSVLEVQSKTDEALKELQQDVEAADEKSTEDNNQPEDVDGSHTIIKEVKGQSEKSTELSDSKEPSLGGVFNATSKSAHDDLIAARADGMNKEILNHNIQPPAGDIEFTDVKKSDDDETPQKLEEPKEPEVTAKISHEGGPDEKAALNDALSAIEEDFVPDHNPTQSSGAEPLEMVGADPQVDQQIQIDANGQIRSIVSEPLSQAPSSPDDIATAEVSPESPSEPKLPPPLRPDPSAAPAIPEPAMPMSQSPSPTASSVPPPTTVDQPQAAPPPMAPPPLPPRPEMPAIRPDHPSVKPLETPPSNNESLPSPPKKQTEGGYMTEPPSINGSSEKPENPLFTQQL